MKIYICLYVYTHICTHIHANNPLLNAKIILQKFSCGRCIKTAHSIEVIALVVALYKFRKLNRLGYLKRHLYSFKWLVLRKLIVNS